MSAIGKQTYKYCLVPCCTNTTITAPDKIFLCVPNDRSKRNAWTKAMKRDNKKNPALSTKSTHWCCEDHFSLEEDMENYWQWKLTGNVKRYKLKDGVVPHLFECQKKFLSPPVPKGALKRKRNEQVQVHEQAISGIESQNVAETSSVIKQEPVESVDEPPRLVIKNIHRAEELASSSSCGSAPLPENALPFANPDSTNVGEAPAAHIPNKPAQKRKINDAEPDAAQAKLCRRTIPSLPSKRNSKQHPPAGTSPKSAGRSTLPTKNDENATREMFQSLLDSSENNPLFGSRTTERPGDLFDVFADFIAEKLRGMDWDDCAYALRAILDVVFKTGKAQDDGE
ncbi:hypothetical protein AVEN_55765-2 [Araneus ventricosus]|uniref:THAP-type domain-containing protein n=1 Tax=Araneus ventricosus TaxID=182803 RepID=A0A4Y2F022_ARAVE|nr:hypothetical protein AVEN_55765-2 [Araneus ventricosus]